MEYIGRRYSILFPKPDGGENREYKTYTDKIQSIIENQDNFNELILSCANGDILQRDRLINYSVSNLYNELQNYVIKAQKNNKTDITNN